MLLHAVHELGDERLFMAGGELHALDRLIELALVPFLRRSKLRLLSPQAPQPLLLFRWRSARTRRGTLSAAARYFANVRGSPSRIAFESTPKQRSTLMYDAPQLAKVATSCASKPALPAHPWQVWGPASV